MCRCEGGNREIGTSVYQTASNAPCYPAQGRWVFGQFLAAGLFRTSCLQSAVSCSRTRNRSNAAISSRDGFVSASFLPLLSPKSPKSECEARSCRDPPKSSSSRHEQQCRKRSSLHLELRTRYLLYMLMVPRDTPFLKPNPSTSVVFFPHISTNRRGGVKKEVNREPPSLCHLTIRPYFDHAIAEKLMSCLVTAD